MTFTLGSLFRSWIAWKKRRGLEGWWDVNLRDVAFVVGHLTHSCEIMGRLHDFLRSPFFLTLSKC